MSDTTDEAPSAPLGDVMTIDAEEGAIPGDAREATAQHLAAEMRSAYFELAALVGRGVPLAPPERLGEVVLDQAHLDEYERAKRRYDRAYNRWRHFLVSEFPPPAPTRVRRTPAG